MPLRSGRPGKIKLSSEQLRQADHLDPRRVCQQLVEGLLAQRAQALDELPRFLKRLSLSDVAEEFEERALGYGDEYVRPAVWDWLQP